MDLGQLEYSASNTAIIKVWESIFTANKLDKTKIAAFVLDGGKNFQLAGRKFSSGTQASVFWCACHRVNLISKWLFKKGPRVLGNLFKKGKKIMAKFARSFQLSFTFRQQQMKFGGNRSLVQPIDVRWNSAFDMFCSMVENKEALNSALVIEGASSLCFSEEDWTILEFISGWSGILTNMITTLQSDTTATIDLVYMQLQILFFEAKSLQKAVGSHCSGEEEEEECEVDWRDEGNLQAINQGSGEEGEGDQVDFPGIDEEEEDNSQSKKLRGFKKLLGKALHTALCHYFFEEPKKTYDPNSEENKLLIFSCWLNPELNSFYFLKPTKAATIIEYCQKKAHNIIGQQRASSSLTQLSWQHPILQQMRIANRRETKAQTEFHPEIHKYQEETDSGGLSVLEWWRVNEVRYPLLSKVACQYLCIPASSATSERAFSAAGLIVTPLRNGLDEKTSRSLTRLSFNK